MTRILPSIREQVRLRAQQRCEYCRKPEIAAHYSHHVDHIIPLRHDGSSDLTNLAWACFQCNTTKAADIASYDPVTKLLTPLYHPRVQKWDDHFAMEEAIILARTAIGRVTIHILQMNHVDQIETRQQLINANRW